MTAVFNDVHIVPVGCDKDVFPTDDYLNELGTFWNTDQQNSLAAFGVTFTMIRASYEKLRIFPAVQFHRSASTRVQLGMIADIMSAFGLSRGLHTGGRSNPEPSLEG